MFEDEERRYEEKCKARVVCKPRLVIEMPPEERAYVKSVAAVNNMTLRQLLLSMTKDKKAPIEPPQSVKDLKTPRKRYNNPLDDLLKLLRLK